LARALATSRSLPEAGIVARGADHLHGDEVAEQHAPRPVHRAHPTLGHASEDLVPSVQEAAVGQHGHE